MRTWIKSYTKQNHDPDVGSLTWAQRGIWHALLNLCGELDNRNGDGSETGELDTQERVAWRIRCDPLELGEALSAFAERGWIETRDSILYVKSYPRLQAKPPSQTPEANKERQREWRARNKDVTSLSQGVTPSEAETEADTDSDSEKKQRQRQIQSDDVTAAAAALKFWEGITDRKVTPRDRELIQQAIQTHGLDRLRYAMREANDYDARTWAYVQAILDGEGESNARDPPPINPSGMGIAYVDPFTSEVKVTGQDEVIGSGEDREGPG